MVLTYVRHEKIVLKKHPQLNEAWLQERIAADPTILGLGDIRLLDRERSITGAGRLDLLLIDDDNNRRFEVEIQLGDTDPSHIMRCIEYWDSERRRYPAYEHVAVIVAESVTTRFLNLMALLAGSIPIVAIQLDAICVADSVLLNFVQVLDQTELRVDDTDESGGEEVDRAYWDQKVGMDLMKMCDEVLTFVNSFSTTQQELNYRRGYVGLRSNGVVRNTILMSLKPTKKIAHLFIYITDRDAWRDKFEEENIPTKMVGKGRLRITLTPNELNDHADMIKGVIKQGIEEYEG